MNAVLLCGSPRAKKSNSAYLLEQLRDRMEKDALAEVRQAAAAISDANERLAESVAASDVLVIALPLYADAIPSALYEALDRIREHVSRAQTAPMLYLIVNSGFYEARQNELAIEMLWNWCAACGMRRGRALAVGAGEMSQVAKMGAGPLKNLGRALDELANDIGQGRSGETMFVEPNFPRLFYRMAGHRSWNEQAKKNGLKPRDLLRAE